MVRMRSEVLDPHRLADGAMQGRSRPDLSFGTVGTQAHGWGRAYRTGLGNRPGCLL